MFEEDDIGSSQESGRKFRPHSWAVGLLAFLLLSGCRHYRPTESGYLSDYSQLQKDPFHINYGVGFQKTKTHYATSEDIGEIDSFYIEPSKWLVDEKSRAGGNAWRRDFLLGELQKSLRNQLGEVRPIVDHPGPKTATIRSAITVVRLSRPLVNVALTATYFTPFGIGPIFFGGGVIEAEAIGPDGRQIAAISSGSTGGWIDIVGYYTKTGHAKKAMRRNTHELIQALEACDNFRGTVPPPPVVLPPPPPLPPLPEPPVTSGRS